MKADTLYKHSAPIRNELLSIRRGIGLALQNIPRQTVVVQESETEQPTAPSSIVLPSSTGDNKPFLIKNTNSFTFNKIAPIALLEELKCIVITPAPEGTTFVMKDNLGTILIEKGEIVVDRIGATTKNFNAGLLTETTLTGFFEDLSVISQVEIIFFLKVWAVYEKDIVIPSDTIPIVGTSS